YLLNSRVGLLTHDACRTSDNVPTRLAVASAIGSAMGNASGRTGLVTLFSPEHGIASDAAAGAAVDDSVDAATGLPVISLYCQHQYIEPDLLDGLDIILVDLRDVGVRCFTYAATAAQLAAAAARVPSTPELIVCDRPNPLGKATAGPPLDPELRSLVAWFDVPFVHGSTIGGLLDAEARRRGYPRPRVFAGADNASGYATSPWIPPSPALDHPDAVRLYSGLVLLEATNLDEGRGTPVPFRSVAAPWLDTAALAADVARWGLPVTTRQSALAPAVGNYAGQRLPALEFTIPTGAAGCCSTAAVPFDSFAFGVRLLCTIAARHCEFSWTQVPAGGATARFGIDSLLGNAGLRTAMAAGDDADTILARWQH
ncbi:MAG: exo-beta-N-acetylmuramidase NamZ domain-containing protein, partial [Alphaproteobacteria bacterium]